MKHFYSTCLVVMTCMAATAANPIRIVFDNDVHCALDGYVAIAGVRDSLAQTDAANTALVSSGDYLQGGSMGSISKGQYCVDMINAAQYDALTLGNHEFDYKIPHLMELIGKMTTEPVSCSLYDLTSEQPRKLLNSYVIKDFSDSRKVAFVGATTPCTMINESYAFYDDEGKLIYTLCPDSFYTLVQQSVDAARKDGADKVVLLSHIGEVKNCQPPFTSQDLIAATSGIDVVLDGHSHSVIESERIMNKEGQPVLLSQTGTQVKNVGVLTIDTDQDTVYTQLLGVATCPRSEKVQHVLDSINQLAQGVLGEKVGTTDFALTIENTDTGKRAVRNAETNLGDLVTDAFRSIVPGAQICVQNGGAIRKTINKGTITVGNVLDALSFCTMIWSYSATGQMLIDFLEEACQDLPAEGTFLQVSGLKMQIDTTQHPTIDYDPTDSTVTISGTRRVFDIQVLQADSSYQPINPKDEYLLIATDYVVFQQKMHSLLKCKVLTMNIMEDNAALRQYIEEDLSGVIPVRYKDPYGQKRIVFADHPTGMENVNDNHNDNHNCKVMINGQLIIIHDGVRYNVMGMRQ